jgi:hypothetical protein
MGLVAAAAAGCGGSDQSHQVRSTFQTLVNDLSNRNPAACSLFTKRYALENTGQSSYSVALAKCRSRVRSGAVTVPNGLRVAKVKVKGNAATLKASAPGQGTGLFHFLKQNNQWKIDMVTSR